VGRSHHHVARARQHYPSFSHSTKYQGICRLGRVRFISSGLVIADTFRRTKKKDIYVISTPMRPVPLEHFLWAGKDLHKIVDSKSKFLGEG
jgi:hypothetical protein